MCACTQQVAQEQQDEEKAIRDQKTESLKQLESKLSLESEAGRNSVKQRIQQELDAMRERLEEEGRKEREKLEAAHRQSINDIKETLDCQLDKVGTDQLSNFQ